MKSMKRFGSILAAAAVLALAACGGGNAQAQSIGPNGQAVFGNTTNMLTVDLWSARYVDMTPGAQKVYAKDGTTVFSGAFVNDSAFTYSEPAKRYAKLSTYLYINLSQAAKVECSGGNTIISWNVGGAEVVADSCSRASTIYGLSRR